MVNKRAIVIGSGVGGLATAIRLAHSGWDVSVYEKNAHVGGKVHSKTINGYRFDMGPSVFTEPNLIVELLDLAPKAEPFIYQELPESGRYFFEDGTSLIILSGTNGTIKVFEQELNEDKLKTKQYLSRLKKNYTVLYPVFIASSLHRLKHWCNSSVLPALKEIPFLGLTNTMNGFSKRYFKNPKTIQILNRYATYNGSNPYKTPGLLSIIGNLELNIGSFFPKGGMVSISERLAATAKSMGVQIYCNSPVTEILSRDGKVSGVRVGNESLEADLVVSNADIHYTYQRLMPNINGPKKILSQEKSSSAVVFYWGIKKSFPELGVHNVLFSAEYEAEFKAIFNTKTMFNDPSIYIHISSKVEKDDAPEACENWFVMINAPVDEGQDWEAMVKKLRQQVIEKINRNLKINIAEFIEVEHVNSPVSLNLLYNSIGGSIYGNSSNSIWSAFYRHPNHCPDLKGLYFAGVTVHPGGGIPLALNGAKIVERMVREDFNLPVEKS